uniref:PorP/SprF family type IX secretion system membrane protein n=1 Tax=uncultured Draconibacterium sp. TaxID=1573823 RepID=UPI003217EAA7
MNLKNSNVIPPVAVLAIILLFISFQLKTNAQEGAYWTGLSFKNPAAISTPSDWIYGSFSHLAYDFADYGKESFNLVTGSFDYRISQKAGTIGLDFYHTKFGLESANLVKVNYAYDFKVFEAAILSFGISGGTTFYKNVLSEYQLYPLEPNDPLLNNIQDEHYKTFNGNIGVYFYSERLSAGLSATVQEQISGENNLSIDIPAVFTGVFSYKIVNTQNFALTPNLMTDYSDKDFSFIPGIFAEYKKTFWAGYQNSDFEDFHSLMLGIDLKQRFRIGYSYSFNDFLKSETLNTHDFLLGFNIQ